MIEEPLELFVIHPDCKLGSFEVRPQDKDSRDYCKTFFLLVRIVLLRFEKGQGPVADWIGADLFVLFLE